MHGVNVGLYVLRSRHIYLSLRSKGSTVAANRSTDDKYTIDVVMMAIIVPMGIDA